MPVRCKHCCDLFETPRRLSQHLGLKQTCQEYYDNLAHEHALLTAGQPPNAGVVARPAEVPPDANVAAPPYAVFDAQMSPEPDEFYNEPAGVPHKRRRVTVEDVKDADEQGAPWISERYPGSVAAGLGTGVTHYEDLRAEQAALREPPEAPFLDTEEWGLARWLMKRTTQTAADEYCKLPIVCQDDSHATDASEADSYLVDQKPNTTELQEQEGPLEEDRQAADGTRVVL